MAFGNLNSTYRLGIANTHVANKFRWAREILRLSIETFPQPFPIYQGFVGHAVNHWSSTWSIAADQCWASGGDSEDGLSHVLRQVAAYDTLFSRKNITPGVYPATPQTAYSMNSHSNNRYGQMYFVQNEPESVDSPQYIGDVQTCSDTLISGDTGVSRNSTIDPVIDTLGAIPYIEFWEEPNFNGARRATATAMALVFLRIKRILEAQNRSHVVIAPAPSAPLLGAFNAPPISDPYGIYWGQFYNAIRDGAAVNAPISGQPTRKEQENGTPPKDLKVLNLHHYIQPRDVPGPNNTRLNAPMETVAEGAYGLKLGVDWFRGQYNKNSQGQQLGALDMDVLLSETGPDWRIAGNIGSNLTGSNPKHNWAWAGGWDNFRDGLSWWNSWLCWMMRRAPIASECNLANSPNGVKTDAHALYACIHAPDDLPYSTRWPSGIYWNTSTAVRNQAYFHADNWAAGSVSGKVFINSPQMNSFGRYQTSFSAFDPTNWDSDPGTGTATTWRIGPFGACYKVWSQVASDLINTSFGAGWYANSQAGVIGETTIDLPGGPNGVGVYSTVYFPIIKSFGTFAANTQFNVTWRKAGRPDYAFGYLGAASSTTTEFPDSKTVTQISYDFSTKTYGPLVNIPPQTIYSSMILPVVCYSTSPQTVTVRLSRNIAGPYVSLGRPIVLRQACSWLSNQ